MLVSKNEICKPKVRQEKAAFQIGRWSTGFRRMTRTFWSVHSVVWGLCRVPWWAQRQETGRCVVFSPWQQGQCTVVMLRMIICFSNCVESLLLLSRLLRLVSTYFEWSLRVNCVRLNVVSVCVVWSHVCCNSLIRNHLSQDADVRLLSCPDSSPKHKIMVQVRWVCRFLTAHQHTQGHLVPRSG